MRAFADALGGDLDETGPALAADNEPAAGAPVRPARPDRPPPSWPSSRRHASARSRRTRSTCPAARPATWPAVRDGRAHVQDEGSQLVAAALADAPLDGPDERWLDLCAGPGGKAGAARRAGRAARRPA